MVLATGAFSAPILSEPIVGGHVGYWAPRAYHPWAPGLTVHRVHHPHRFVFGDWRPTDKAGGLDAGFSQCLWGNPAAEAPDMDESQPGEDGPESQIAATGDLEHKSDPIPAVPEPGSLAMLGAGGLGLLAARGLLKRK